MHSFRYDAAARRHDVPDRCSVALCLAMSSIALVVQCFLKADTLRDLCQVLLSWAVENSTGALTIARRLRHNHETLLHVPASSMSFAPVGRLIASGALKQPFPNRRRTNRC